MFLPVFYLFTGHKFLTLERAEEGERTDEGREVRRGKDCGAPK